MDYIKGQSLKPLFVSENGVVIFTDDKETAAPNEEQCKAYGYTWDPITATCLAFNYNNKLTQNLQSEDNSLLGSANVIRRGTSNSFIVGEKNIVEGLSRNNIIGGMQNKISNNIKNTYVYGTLAESTADNSIVLGGNKTDDILGERQNITLMYGGVTTDGTTTDAYLNNTTDSYFQPVENSVFYFESETVAVRIGGVHSSGSVGDFKAWVERGVVKNARGALSIDRSRTSPAEYGTTGGWSPVNAVLGSNFRQTIEGHADMTIEWASTIRITEIRTSVTL